jgi:formate--tetrahydrofolate ligase
MNDRALRRIAVGEGGSRRDTGFVITAASEVMAIVALATDRADLRRRLGEIVVGLAADGSAVRARDLRASGAMCVLLNDAILPNLVQTGEGTPAIIHAGPFGNVAHGTSSVIAQRIALQSADFVVNEAGFGSDLGAEKYFDIVMPASGLVPAAAVLVVSARAVAAGLDNLRQHMDNLRRFGVPFVVAINRFAADSEADLAAISDFCRACDAPCAHADVFARGGEGGEELARLVVEQVGRGGRPEPLYQPELPLVGKIEAVAKRVYGASDVVIEPDAAEMLDRFTALGYGRLPVCMAKTQYSLSDDAKRSGAPRGWTLRVTGANLAAGAGFVVAVAGSMMLMPGLGKDPQAAHMDVDSDGQIVGLG